MSVSTTSGLLPGFSSFPIHYGGVIVAFGGVKGGFCTIKAQAAALPALEKTALGATVICN